jgi:serine protease inhibitor
MATIYQIGEQKLDFEAKERQEFIHRYAKKIVDEMSTEDLIAYATEFLEQQIDQLDLSEIIHRAVIDYDENGALELVPDAAYM